jgi:putative SOS response-associated peptidase YedK
MRWGLLPAWMADRPGTPLINARAETVAEKPAFKSALRHRRCLVPADGFFEWAPVQEGAPKGARKQPYWFRRADHGLFAMAGLWEPPNARAPHGSYTLVTTAPNATVAPVHDRMPVILPPEAYAVWLDSEVMDPAALVPLLRPFGAAMTSEPVSTRLNATRGENDPTLLQPDPPPPPDLRLF